MADVYNFNGLGMGMGNLSQLSNAQTRSLSAENFSGLKGQGGMAVKGTGAESARDLGQGWKISPSIIIGPKSTFTLADIQAWFHAQWRRSNPLADKQVHTLLDGVQGKGQYVGTYLAWQVNTNGWWGEGEMKFFLDGDSDFPTICGTGTEDYFGGAWNFEYPQGEYGVYSTAFLGLPQVIKPDGLYHSQQRFGMYRWHIMDPIRFEEDLRVTIQALGWRSGRRYLPLQDDIASTSFWYQTEPHVPYPQLP